MLRIIAAVAVGGAVLAATIGAAASLGLPPAPTDDSVFCQEQPALASGRAA